MVVDFIKEGSTGIWYMLQVKGFELVQSESLDHRMLIWNYQRMLRLAKDDDYDRKLTSEYHDFTGQSFSHDQRYAPKQEYEGRPTSAKKKLMKSISESREKIPLSSVNLNNYLTSSKERVKRLMDDRGTRCKLCGLYYVNDSVISIFTGSSETKSSPDKSSHKSNSASGSGPESNGAGIKNVPAYGYFITMSMAFKLMEIYREHNASSSGKHNETLPMTKFGREILARGGNTSNPSSSWLSSMYESVTCCYYCHQIVEEHFQYINSLLQFNKCLGMNIEGNESKTASSRSAKETKEHLVEKESLSVSPLISSTISQIEREIVKSLEKRTEFLTRWWSNHQKQVTEHRESMLDAKTVASLKKKSLDEACSAFSESTYSVQMLMKFNTAASHDLPRSNLTRSNICYHWKMLIMSHFITDTVHNELLNHIIFNHYSKHGSMHRFNNENMQLYGRLQYTIGQKISTLDFPLVSAMGSSSSSSGIHGDADQYDRTDPVVWIKQCR